jgi:hypothetical protein
MEQPDPIVVVHLLSHSDASPLYTRLATACVPSKPAPTSSPNGDRAAIRYPGPACRRPPHRPAAGARGRAGSRRVVQEQVPRIGGAVEPLPGRGSAELGDAHELLGQRHVPAEEGAHRPLPDHIESEPLFAESLEVRRRSGDAQDCDGSFRFGQGSPRWPGSPWVPMRSQHSLSGARLSVPKNLSYTLTRAAG